MSKQFRFESNGGITVLDEAGPSHQFVPKYLGLGINPQWRKLMEDAEIEILPYPKTFDEAEEEGNQYIEQFFSRHRQMYLMALANFGSTSQKQMVGEVFAWINNLQGQAAADPRTFKPTGNPPHTYQEIINANGS